MLKIFFCLLINQIMSKMIIQSPVKLAQEFKYMKTNGRIHYALSFFGNMLYNESTFVQVVIPNKKNLLGCDEHEMPKNLLTNHFFILALRGTCTYAKKTYEAQEIGALGVIIQDNEFQTDNSYDFEIPVQDKIYT